MRPLSLLAKAALVIDSNPLISQLQEVKIMLHTATEVKETLTNLIHHLKSTMHLYVKNPGKDFTRERKLSFEKVITWIYTRKEPFIKRQYLRAVTKKLILCDKIEHPEKNTI